MTTHALPPWAGGGDELASEFLGVDQAFRELVKSGEFVLTQRLGETNRQVWLDELMWRHYIVFWSVRFAARNTICKPKNLVECGVCDGMSSYFAMRAVEDDYQFKSYLYDAWEAMDAEDLLESEKGHAGEYNYLDVRNTQRNLEKFKANAILIKGRVPATFHSSPCPDELVWMHIDLNAALPTTAALDHYFDRLAPGGIVLLDDYGWRDYYDTKLAVDHFFEGKPGMLFCLPTGQAAYFKH